MKKKAVILFLIIIFIPLIYAKEPIQKAEIYGGGVYIDKESKKKDPSWAQATAEFAWKQRSPGIKSWCLAAAWVGRARASLRTYHYKTFGFVNIKPGTKFKVNIRFKVSLFGVINTSSFSAGENFYKAKISVGVHEGANGPLNSPIVEKVIWAKTNKKEWVDWAEEVAQTVASEAIEEATGVVGIGTILDVVDYTIDALDADEVISKEITYEFKNVPVEAGKTYRVYVSLDSLVVAAGAVAGEAGAYINFYKHKNYFLGENIPKLRKWGIGIKEVSIEIPEGLPYPIGVGPNRPDLTVKSIDITPSKPKLDESINIKAVIENKGAIDASEIPFVIKCGGKIIFKQIIKELKKEESIAIETAYNIKRTGKHKFVAIVDPENKIDELKENNNSAYESVYIAPEPDLLLQTEEISGKLAEPSFGVESEKGGAPQIGVPTRIWVKVYNFGNRPAKNVHVLFEKDGKPITSVFIPYIKRNSYRIASIQYTFDKARKYTFKVTVDPQNSISELSESNNSIYFTVEVGLPEYDLSIDSLEFNPESFQAKDEVKFLINVSNKGRAKAPVDIFVYVDSALIKHISTKIPAGEKIIIGDGKPENDLIVWKAESGTHIIKAILKTKGYKDLNEKDNVIFKKISVPEFLPVKGVDFVLRKEDVKLDRKSCKVRVFNRGTKSATALVKFKVFYIEENEVKSKVLASFARIIPAKKYRDFSINYSQKPPFKMVISVDPYNRVREVNEDNNEVTYTYGNFEKAVQQAYKRKQKEKEKEKEMQKRVPLMITGFWGTDTPIKVGETKSIGAQFKNISGRSLRNIVVKIEIINVEKERDPKFGYASYVKVWPSVVNKGEFQVTFPYKAVYPGKFKIRATAQVYFGKIVREIVKESYFYVKGGEYPPYYFQEKGADLSIYPQDFILKPSLKVNVKEPVNLFITVHNTGKIDLNNVKVLVKANNTPIHTKILPRLKANSSSSFSFSYTPQTPGPLIFKVIVDPENQIGEVNETNNEVTKQISVHGVWMQLWEKTYKKWKKKIFKEIFSE